MQEINWKSNNENETIELGKNFAQFLKIKDIVALEGDLGSGKTEFIKGICEYFSVQDLVTSPTFTIINQYAGLIVNKEFNIFHIDLYRIKNELELDEIGFEECLNDSDSIKLIEWPKNAGTKLSNIKYIVKIEVDENNEDIRYLSIKSL